MAQDGWIRAVEIVAVVVVLVVGVLAIRRLRRSPDLGTAAERATFDTLHTASLAAPPLRDGLTPEGAQRAIRHLRTLLGTPAVALADSSRLLAWDGEGAHHQHQALRHAAGAIASGRTSVLSPAQIDGEEACGVLDCPLRSAVVAPLTSGDTVVGALIAYGGQVSAALVRATGEVATWVSAQIELAELDRSRTRAIEAEVRALRAQISPHFVYNSLAAIASFVRTDPERARELLLEFADFTRYAFRRGGEFTTLADELRNIERYLVLEQARFGDRLRVRLRVAPEVLPVAVPYLSVQPLVENAVRHGLQAKEGGGQITLGAADSGAEALIWVEDDGVGADPELIERVLAGAARGSESESVGLGNVDARLRQVFGDRFGLVVETAPGAGTKVSFRVPKYAPGVHAGPPAP
ncbi:histidine kinase [Kineosporia rhizophila]|uniref:sensor histidine kinase n=1 Tax=Kineosporia rhizophila TaxID=84633 RepID=UPI001E6503CF|nr:histidine kinase [Kineosporia sp. NBRC 101677]MCE0540062.1 histidine kinase [Kineosporia rhizophila]GLY19204.1 signal transduction histidine kinase [Kineosporia sp. NBRC 101677]